MRDCMGRIREVRLCIMSRSLGNLAPKKLFTDGI